VSTRSGCGQWRFSHAGNYAAYDRAAAERSRTLVLSLTRNLLPVILNHMVQYSSRLDASFAALSDPTRRGILERLGRGDASISDLAAQFGMTLTGIKKHVAVLEEAELVTTKKVGRVRYCSLGPRRLEAETAWMVNHQRMLEARLDRLGEFLERTKGEQP
jgi:DNA-binding transcriptional ArsR family regulator